MSQQDFEDSLRQFLRREPFQPFVVELLDGRVILIEQRSLAFAGGAATYGTATKDLVFFDCEEVRAIREAAHEMSS